MEFICADYYVKHTADKMVVRRLQSKRQDIKNESLKTSLNNNTGAAIKYYTIKKQINDKINVYYGIKERAI